MLSCNFLKVFPSRAAVFVQLGMLLEKPLTVRLTLVKPMLIFILAFNLGSFALRFAFVENSLCRRLNLCKPSIESLKVLGNLRFFRALQFFVCFDGVIKD